MLDVATGWVRAQREIGAKTNEIPELAPAIAHLDLIGAVVTLDALHTQAETARHLVEGKHAHYLCELLRVSRTGNLRLIHGKYSEIV